MVTVRPVPLVVAFLLASIIMGTGLFSQEPVQGDWKYFGQDPPGEFPEVFAPGIVSGAGRVHCFPAISPEGDEVFWMTLPPEIHFSRYDGIGWVIAGPPAYFDGFLPLRPTYSQDGRRIYFAASLPGGFGSLDIWYIEFMDDLQSEPVNLGPMVNSSGFEAQQTFTEDGTIYFNGPVEGKRWERGILRARYSGNGFSQAEVLGDPINIFDSLAIDYTPFIAKDESYLLFSSNRHDPGGEQCNIYVSFRDAMDSWSNPVNLNERMGFKADCRDPAISPDQKYLFFSSGQNVYWLDAEIINRVRNKQD